MSFANIRKNLNVKTPYSQKGVNLLPSWAYARTAEFSNFQLSYSEQATEYAEVKADIERMKQDCFASLSNYWYKGEVFEYLLDSDFAFEYKDLVESVRYTAPNIIGFIGVNSYELNEVELNKSDYLLKDFTLESMAGELVDNDEIQNNPRSYSITSGGYQEVKIPVDNYIYVEILADSPLGVDFEGSYNNSSFSLVSVRGNSRYRFDYGCNGIYRSSRPVRKGTYYIEFDTVNMYMGIRIWVFPEKNIVPELSYPYYNEILGSSFSYELDSEDGSYLNLVTNPQNIEALISNVENKVIEKAVIFTDGNEPHEMKSITGTDHMPLVFALSNEENNKVFLYERYLEQARSFHSGNVEPLIDIEVECIDWRIGDEVLVKTRRAAGFMDQEISKVRLKVTNIEKEEVVYIKTTGEECQENEAWINTDLSIGRYKESRWAYEVKEAGTIKFELEVNYKNKEIKSTASYIICVGSKKPLAEFTVNMPGGEVLEEICVWSDGNLYGISTSGKWYKLPLIFKGAYIDYENNVISTLTKFDYLEVTYE